jgi:hypothetical protein
MNKNTKIGIGIGILALLFIAYKKGVFGGNGGAENEEVVEEEVKSSIPSNLPIVDVSSGSETPQVAVVNIPPQFGGNNVVTASNLPTGAGTWGSYAS